MSSVIPFPGSKSPRTTDLCESVVMSAYALLCLVRGQVIWTSPLACGAHSIEMKREIDAAMRWLDVADGEPQRWVARDVIADVWHGLETGALVSDQKVIAWVRGLGEMFPCEGGVAPCGWFDAPEQVARELTA